MDWGQVRAEQGGDTELDTRLERGEIGGWQGTVRREAVAGTCGKSMPSRRSKSCDDDDTPTVSLSWASVHHEKEQPP